MSTKQQITLTGFTNKITLYTNYTSAKEYQLLCNSIGFDINPKIIYSSGSFNGGIDFENDKLIGLTGQPRHDYIDLKITVNFQYTVEDIGLIKDLIKNRNQKIKIDIKNILDSQNDKYEFNNCYWSHITLDTKQHSLLTGTIQFVVIQETDDIYALKLLTSISRHYNNDDINERIKQSDINMYNSSCDYHVIPYYATTIENNNTFHYRNKTDEPDLENDDPQTSLLPIGWSIDISQAVNVKTFCNIKTTSENKSNNLNNNNSNYSNFNDGIRMFAPAPTVITFGILTASLNTQLLLNLNGYEINRDILKTCINQLTNDFKNNDSTLAISYMNKGRKTTLCKLKHLMLTSITPNFSDVGNYSTIDVRYSSHAIDLSEISEAI